MAQQAQIEKQREIVRALLKDPNGSAGRMKAELAARGISVEETAVERVREIVGLVLEEQTRPTDGVLRARPVKGEIDHEALTREIIARFPNILAALAE
jgi:RNase P protein component